MINKKRVQKICELLKLKEFIFVDIGAAGGFDKRWRVLGDYLHVIGFEPNIQEFNKLKHNKKNKNIEYYNFCLAGESHKINFFILRKQTISSFLKPKYDFVRRFKDSARFDIQEEISLTPKTLNEPSASKKIDFIKILTQGSELNILKGGERILRDICGIQITVAFSQYYENQSFFAEVDSYLRKFGFTLFHLRPCYWKRMPDRGGGRGQIILAEALYLKDYIMLNTIPSTIGPSIITSILYKKYDFALETLKYCYNKGVLSQTDLIEIEKNILNIAKPIIKFPSSFGRRRVVLCLERAINLLTAYDCGRFEEWD